MSEVVRFLQATNLHLWLLLVVTAAVTVFATVKRVQGVKVDLLPSALPVVLAMGMGYALQEMIKNVSELGIRPFFARLEVFAPNRYAREKLNEIEGTITKFTGMQYEVNGTENSLWEMVKAVNNAEHEAFFLDHYVTLWAGNLERLRQASMAAAQRGVRVTRIFVLREDLLKDDESTATVKAVIDGQRRDGIEVMVAKEDDLIERFMPYAAVASNNVALIDGRVLIEATPTSQARKLPGHAIVIWDEKRVRELSPFAELLRAEYVLPWDRAASWLVHPASAKAR